MKSLFSFSSQEISDKLLLAYENLVYILGRQDENGTITYSGLYNNIETSGINMMLSPSGILHVGTEKQSISELYSTKDINFYLKFDYIYKKHFGEINYMETKNGK